MGLTVAKVKAPKVGDKFMWLQHEVIIVKVEPYTGKYSQLFTHVITFYGPTGTKLQSAWPC